MRGGQRRDRPAAAFQFDRAAGRADAQHRLGRQAVPAQVDVQAMVAIADPVRGQVGAVMIVGGNIDGVTRVMTTSIALETSKGDLPLALALGLVLLAVVGMLNALVAWMRPSSVSSPEAAV